MSRSGGRRSDKPRHKSGGSGARRSESQGSVARSLEDIRAELAAITMRLKALEEAR